ncbi:SLOG family protein [Segatella copri]
MSKYRVIIAGCRDFDNYELLKEKCDYFLQDKEDVVIISGHASGADALIVF